jgi:hypothetical protein
MKKKGKTLLTGLGLILTLALCLTACGTSKTQEITSKSHSVIKSIGTASNNLNAYKAKVQNKTGKKITSVEIKNSIDNEYGDDLLDSGDTFKNNEVRYMYYDATDAVNTAQEDGKEESSIKYYVKVTLDNDSTYVISKFPFNKIKGTAKIYFDSDKEVCYLIYTNKSGKKINTKKKEKKSGTSSSSSSSSSYNDSSSSSSSSYSSGRYGVGSSASNGYSSGTSDYSSGQSSGSSNKGTGGYKAYQTKQPQPASDKPTNNPPTTDTTNKGTTTPPALNTDSNNTNSTVNP